MTTAFRAWAASHPLGAAAELVGFGLLFVVPMRKIFLKAGRPGWAAFIPFYNLAVMARIGGLSGWVSLLVLAPLIGGAFFGHISSRVARKFGKGGMFQAGAFFLALVFLWILAFGPARYPAERS